MARVMRTWTDEEKTLLKRNAPNMTSSQLAKLLNRGIDSVKHKARQMGVSLRKYGEACSWAKYSNEVVEQARGLHESGVTPREISRKLGVPYWNICDFVYFKRGLGYGYET